MEEGCEVVVPSIQPGDVTFSDGGHGMADAFINTLGRPELEFAAVLVARYHHVHGLTEWTPVSRQQIAGLFESDPVTQAWARNPFWRPDPFDFASNGYIDGWDVGPDIKGSLTQKFFDDVAAEHRRRAERCLEEQRRWMGSMR